MLKLIKLVLELTDKPVYEMLGGTEENIDGYMFCCSWIMTWFAHDIKSWTNLQRLYDLFLAREPFFVIYFCAAFISENREAIEDAAA